MNFFNKMSQRQWSPKIKGKLPNQQQALITKRDGRRKVSSSLADLINRKRKEKRVERVPQLIVRVRAN